LPITCKLFWRISNGSNPFPHRFSAASICEAICSRVLTPASDQTRTLPRRSNTHHQDVQEAPAEQPAGALDTIVEENALLDAAGMSALRENAPAEAILLRQLPARRAATCPRVNRA
jgi:hypothetical protein